MESQEAAFHPSHTPSKPLRDYHIPTASTAGVFRSATASEDCVNFLTSVSVQSRALTLPEIGKYHRPAELRHSTRTLSPSDMTAHGKSGGHAPLR